MRYSIYIDIYKTETFETLTIFQVSIIFKKKKKKKKNQQHNKTFLKPLGLSTSRVSPCLGLTRTQPDWVGSLKN